MNEFIEQFLVECHELVAQATDDLLSLEERPGDRTRLDSAFRAFHTLKGAAGIVEFAAMESALHAAEDGLSAARADLARMTPRLIGDCLGCLDQVSRWLEAMQDSGEPPPGAQADADAVIARFQAAPPRPSMEPELRAVAKAGFSPESHALLVAQLDLLEEHGVTAGAVASAGRVALRVLGSMGRDGAVAALEQALSRQGDDARAEARGIIRGVLAPPAPAAPYPPGTDAGEPATRLLRVDIERVDALVRLAGELMVAKNALGHAAALAAAGETAARLAARLKDQHATLDRLVGELHRSVLNIRVLPLRHMFQRFPRLVREMVVSLGKPVRLVTEGDATEADKAVVDDLFEPLLHVVRNAMDHGVEDGEGRAAAGKPPSATIRLHAERRGDRVLIEVEDDGAGIDLARVRAVAADRGVATREALARMSEPELVDLIFAPGFSTAREVTRVSGRGVGMDAVRQAVERLGGRVGVTSRPGRGTTVRFDLPFTVMMTRVVTVEVGGQVFGVPIEAVVESVRLRRERIAQIGAARAFTLRGRTVPLIDLGDLLGGEATDGGDAGDELVVVVAADGQLGGLAVDRLGEPLDIMLKPMEGLMAGSPGIAGASLMGDGRVLIVLDPDALMR